MANGAPKAPNAPNSVFSRPASARSSGVTAGPPWISSSVPAPRPVEFGDLDGARPGPVLQVHHRAADQLRGVCRVARIPAEEAGIHEPRPHMHANRGEQPEVPDPDEHPVAAARGRARHQPHGGERPGVCRVDEQEVRRLPARSGRPGRADPTITRAIGPDQQIGQDVLAARPVLAAEPLDELLGFTAHPIRRLPVRVEVAAGSLGVPERSGRVLAALLGVVLVGEDRVLVVAVGARHGGQPLPCLARSSHDGSVLGLWGVPGLHVSGPLPGR